MRELKHSIYVTDLIEGLLTDIEDTLSAGDDIMIDNMFKDWALNDKCKAIKSKKGYTLKGDYKIKNIDKYTGPIIKNVQGNLAISNTQLENLEGLFDVDCEISGTFTIEDNPKLASLKGCPLQVNTLTITGNKSLKDIDVAPMVMINAYISKNGKKFDKEKLKTKINVYKNIFCSTEDEENIIIENEIYEAFKAPQLKLVIDAIKKHTNDLKKEEKFSLKQLFNIEWDKIESSQVSEYDTSDAKAITLARKYISQNIVGLIILLDKDGEVTAVIRGKYYLRLMNRNIYGQNNKLYYWSNIPSWSTTELIKAIQNNDTILFVELTDTNLRGAWEKHNNRVEARKGATALMRGHERTGKTDPSTPWILSDTIDDKNVRYFQSIAEENRERYKKLLVQIKAKRLTLSNNFNNIKTRLDDAFKRYTTLIEKMIKEPSKYEAYDISWLNDKFSSTYISKHNKTTEKYGLFTAIENYVQYMVRLSDGIAYGNTEIEAKLTNLENIIIKHLDAVEAKLTSLESK